jgi:hypothetical protein
METSSSTIKGAEADSISRDFDFNFNKLIGQLDAVIEEGKSTKGGAATNGIVVGFRKYQQMYSHKENKPKDHFSTIRRLWDGARPFILDGEIDGWLRGERKGRNGTLTNIHWGFDSQKFKVKNICIRLSPLYGQACTQADLAQNLLDQQNASVETCTECYTLIRPEIIRLHLLRLFSLVCDVDDEPELAKFISEHEAQLGLDSKGSVETKVTTNAMDGLTQGLSQLDVSGIIKQVAGGLGVTDTSGLPDLGGLISGLVTNDGLRNIANAIQSNVNSTDSPQQVVSKVIGSLSQPDMINQLVNAIPPELTSMIGGGVNLPPEVVPSSDN